LLVVDWIGSVDKGTKTKKRSSLEEWIRKSKGWTNRCMSLQKRANRYLKIVMKFIFLLVKE
jgi:hypothetical protein